MGHPTPYGTTLAAAVFMLLCAVYLFTYSGVITISDEVYIMATAESLAKRGEYTANPVFWKQRLKQVNPDTLEVVPATEPLQSVLGAVLFWLSLRLPHLGAIHSATLLNVFVTALTAVTVMLLVRRLGYSAQAGACCALAFGLCTIAFPYSKLFFREPLAGLLVALAVLCLTGPSFQRPRLATGLAGACLVAAYLTKEVSLAVWPAFAWLLVNRMKAAGGSWHVGRRQVLVALIAGGALLLIAVLLFVFLFDVRGFGGRTLSALVTLPARLGSFNRNAEAFAGMLFSPGRSFFLYSPIALAALWVFPRFYRAHRRDAVFLAAVSLSWLAAYVVLRYDIWWSGLAWGPRFLVPIAPLVVIPLAPLFEDMLRRTELRKHAAILALLAFSVYVQIVGIGLDIRLYGDALYAQIARGERFDPYWNPAFSPPFWMFSTLLHADNWNFAWARNVWGHADYQLGMFDWRIIILCAALLVTSIVALTLAWQGRLLHDRYSGRKLWMAALAITVTTALGVAYFTYNDPRFFGGDDRRRLLETLDAQEQPGDIMVLADNTLGRFVLNYSHATADWYALGFEAEELGAETKILMDHLITVAPRIWLMLPYSANRRQPRPLEQYLTTVAYPLRTQVFSDYAQLILFSVNPPSDPMGVKHSTDWRLGDRIDLTGYDVTTRAPAVAARDGTIVHLSLSWRASAPTDSNYTVFLQLLSPSGEVVWQADRYPVNGLRPTFSWSPGEIVRDNYAIAIAPGWGAGTFRLITGMYEWPSMRRLAVSERGLLTGDYIELESLSLK